MTEAQLDPRGPSISREDSRRFALEHDVGCYTGPRNFVHRSADLKFEISNVRFGQSAQNIRNAHVTGPTISWGPTESNPTWGRAGSAFKAGSPEADHTRIGISWKRCRLVSIPCTLDSTAAAEAAWLPRSLAVGENPGARTRKIANVGLPAACRRVRGEANNGRDPANPAQVLPRTGATSPSSSVTRGILTAIRAATAGVPSAGGDTTDGAELVARSGRRGALLRK